MESNIERQFFQHLSDLGFPKASVIYEPILQSLSVKSKYRPDVALLDPQTNEPLAIIEIKARSDAKSLTNAIKQVQEYIADLRDETVRGFVATPNKSGDGFDFYAPDEDGLPKLISSSWALQFESLSSARMSERKEMLDVKQKSTTDQFIIVCRVAAVLVFCLTVTDFASSLYGVTILTTERMTLIGATIALVVIPYVQKFKGLGIEIDRAVRQIKD